MNCKQWLNCSLAPYVQCPYCKRAPCDAFFGLEGEQ